MARALDNTNVAVAVVQEVNLKDPKFAPRTWLGSGWGRGEENRWHYVGGYIPGLIGQGEEGAAPFDGVHTGTAGGCTAHGPRQP